MSVCWRDTRRLRAKRLAWWKDLLRILLLYHKRLQLHVGKPDQHAPTTSSTQRTYLLEIRLHKLPSERNKPVVPHGLDLHFQQLLHIFRKGIDEVFLQCRSVA